MMNEIYQCSSDFEAKRDWLHDICSQVIQLEDQSSFIEQNMFHFCLSADDYDEILMFVESMPIAQQLELPRYAISSRLDINQKKPGVLLKQQLAEQREHKKNGYFRNRITGFGA